MDSAGGRKFKRRDLAAASLIFTASAVLAFFSYARIADIERVSAPVLSRIPSQSSSFTIMRRGRCVGSLSLQRTEQPRTALDAEGTLRVAYRHLEMEAKFSMKGFFDVQDRLAESRLSLTVGKLKLMMDTHGEEPVNASFEALIGHDSLGYKISLPGPFTLKRNEDGTSRLEYAELSGGKDRLLSAAISGVTEGFELLSSSNGQRGCQAEEGYVDLEPVASILSRNAKKIEQAIGMGS